MATFYEDARSPIVGELIRQGFEVDESEALRILDIDETAHNTDGAIALGTGAACIAATAGTLALAGFVLPILLPALGIGLCGVSYWNSKITARDRETESQFLQDHPEVLNKVQTKIRTGAARDSIAAAYQQVLRSYRWGDDVPLDRVLGKSESQTQQPIGIEESASMSSVPSLATNETQPIAAAPSSSNINGVEPIAPRDIATDLGNHPQSALIFGTPGAGKGMNISNAIRTLRAKLPSVTVMMVDPKGDKKERGYWESQVDIFECRSLLKTSPRSSAEWMMKCIEKFQNIDGPKLLVWDELFASIVVLKGQNIPKGEEPFPCLTDFQQFISLNLSLGPSSGTWVWGMSQSANLSDLGLTSGGLSTTRIIALISPDNVGAVEGYLATKAITAPKGGMQYLDRLMEQSPVGRACYDGKTKKWYPVARLEGFVK